MSRPTPMSDSERPLTLTPRPCALERQGWAPIRAYSIHQSNGLLEPNTHPGVFAEEFSEDGELHETT